MFPLSQGSLGGLRDQQLGRTIVSRIVAIIAESLSEAEKELLLASARDETL